MKGNSVSIKGNLTRNAEIRGISGDRSCVAFGLAWNNNRLQADNTLLDQPHYFEVSCWMSAAQQNYFMPLLTKGTTCSIVDGYLSYGTWITKDGEKRSRVEIAVTDPVSSMTLLAPRKHRPERTTMRYGAPVADEVPNYQATTNAEVDQSGSQAPSASTDTTTNSLTLSSLDTVAPEDTYETDAPFASAEHLDESNHNEVATNTATENESEPDLAPKSDNDSKTESTSSKKRTTA